MARKNAPDTLVKDGGSETTDRIVHGLKTGSKFAAFTAGGLSVAAAGAALFNPALFVGGGALISVLGYSAPALGLVAAIGGGVSLAAGAAGFVIGATSDDNAEKMARKRHLENYRAANAGTQEIESDSKLDKELLRQGNEYALQAERLGLNKVEAQRLGLEVSAPTNLPMGLGGAKNVREM